MKRTEDVCIFYMKPAVYNPQMVKGKPHIRGPFGRQKVATTVYGEFSDEDRTYESDEYYPDNVITFLAEMQPIHPTQKPVALKEYFIKTYTHPGQTVLDFAMGSGTTGVACKNLGRNFIGIEKDEKYYEIAVSRIENAQARLQKEEKENPTQKT